MADLEIFRNPSVLSLKVGDETQVYDKYARRPRTVVLVERGTGYGLQTTDYIVPMRIASRKGRLGVHYLSSMFEDLEELDVCLRTGDYMFAAGL